MKRPGLAALVSVGIGAAVWSAAAGSSVLRPPLAFQGDTWAVVQWVDVARVDAACRQMGATARGRIQGCAKGRALILPNPCRFQGYSADVSCHELAHVNGWSHDPPPVPAPDQPQGDATPSQRKEGRPMADHAEPAKIRLFPAPKHRKTVPAGRRWLEAFIDQC